MSVLADAGANCHSFMCDYLSTQFDPAHLLSELGFTIIFDLLLVFLVWGKLVKPYLERRLNRMHNQLDAEHHVTHHEHNILTDINGGVCEPKQDEWTYDGDGVRRFRPHPPEKKE